MREKTKTEYADGSFIETWRDRRATTMPGGKLPITVVGGSRGSAPIGSELGRQIFGDPDIRDLSKG